MGRLAGSSIRSVVGRHDRLSSTCCGLVGPGRTGPDRTGPDRYSDGTRLDSTPGLTRPDRTWPPLLLLGASSTSRPRHTVAMAIQKVREPPHQRPHANTHHRDTSLMACRTQAKQTNQSIHQLTRLSFARDHTSSLLGVLWPQLNSQPHEAAASLPFGSQASAPPPKRRFRCSTLTCCLS